MSTEDWGLFNNRVVTEAQATCCKIGLEPRPEDRFGWDRWNMAQVHTCLLNRLEATYKNATHIAPNDLRNYWLVAYDDIQFVNEHHLHEEECYFPHLPGELMESNHNQHMEFKDLLGETLSYLESVDPSKPDAEPFSATKFRASMDRWLLVASQHMADELNTLEADNLKKAGVTLDQLKAAINAVNKHREETEVVKYSLPAIIYANPPGSKFPSEAPWFVGAVLAPLFAYGAGRGRMKYYWNARRWETTPPNPPS